MSAIGMKLFSIGEGVRIALDSIRANKVRAGLTILGIAVGVFVVVAISAAVHGINESVAKQFASAGPTTFFVQRFPIVFEACDGSEDTCKWRRNPPIRTPEVEALRRVPSLAAVGEQIGWGASVKYRERLLSSVSIEAFSAEWTTISAPDVYLGRAFTGAEAKNGARVAVINEVMAKRLFDELEPLGKMIAINGAPFQVVGVFREAAGFLSGGDSPKAVLPILSAIRHIGARGNNRALAVKPREGVKPEIAIDDVTATLRAQRGSRPAEPSTFAIITQDKLMETYDSITGMFFLVMISLSAVGLLVGGVGVVAIMMISVTERTREIGVRKALGATKGTIMWQFLVEAATLTGIGGALGLLVGWGVVLLIRNFSPIEASIQPWAAVIALAGSCVTGVLFGILPANRAAGMDPVEALRHE